MLPWQKRLRLRHDFDRLRQSGRRYHQPLIQLVVLQEDSERQLAGFIVSKRISLKATVRNRVKRRLRAAYRACSADLPSGRVFLFIARSGSETVAYPVLLAQMQNLLDRLRVRA